MDLSDKFYNLIIDACIMAQIGVISHFEMKRRGL